jgi:hypothetical protein
MRKAICLAVAVCWLTAACNVSAPNAAPLAAGVDRVATSVSGTMMALAPAESSIVPSQAPPAEAPTQAPPTASLAPTETVPPTDTPTQTPTETPTIAPTATLPSTDPRASLGEPDWEDNFKNGNNWRMGEDPFTKVEVEDKALVLTGRTTSDGWRLTSPTIQNFYLEMTAKTGSCTGTDHYGLFFRVPDKSDPTDGYLFGFSCDGHYQLRKWDGEKMKVLVTPTSSTAIHAGSDQTNRLGVLADGERIVLYANGVLLKEVTDDTYDEGGFGIFVGARKTDGFTIHVTNIAYWDNP